MTPCAAFLVGSEKARRGQPVWLLHTGKAQGLPPHRTSSRRRAWRSASCRKLPAPVILSEEPSWDTGHQVLPSGMPRNEGRSPYSARDDIRKALQDFRGPRWTGLHRSRGMLSATWGGNLAALSPFPTPCRPVGLGERVRTSREEGSYGLGPARCAAPRLECCRHGIDPLYHELPWAPSP